MPAAVDPLHNLPQPPALGPDDAPSRLYTVRCIAVPVLLAVSAGAFFAAGWIVAGVVCCVLTVACVALEVAVGWVFVKYALRAHANMFKTLGPLLAPDDAPAGRSAPQATVLTPEEERHAKKVDQAVGFGLTRAAARSVYANGLLSDEECARLASNICEERSRTHTWLLDAPAWEEVSRPARDGVELVAERLVVAPGSGRWALLCHGYGGEWRSMLQYARHFAEAGYNLLVPHMRGHGKSGGAFIGMGELDRTDVVDWARWLVAGGSANAACNSVVVLGHSMGASSAALAAGEPDLPPEVRALVADCGFDTTWHALSNKLSAAGAPVHPTLDLVRLNLLAHRGGYDIAKGDVCAALAKTNRSVLFVHGLADSMVPPYMATRLYESAAGEKRVLVVPGAGHCQSSLADPDLYWKTVLAFAEEHLA